MAMTNIEIKSALRQHIRARLEKISEAVRAVESIELCERLLGVRDHAAQQRLEMAREPLHGLPLEPLGRIFEGHLEAVGRLGGDQDEIHLRCLV